MPYLIIILQLIILFVLSQSFSQNLYKFWLIITRSRKFAVAFSSIFLLPGTIIHELSHWLVAEILQVNTGKFNLLPKISNDNTGIILGSVKVGKSDPFRRTLIGIAPFLTGILLIFLSSTFLPQNFNLLNLDIFSYLVIIFIFLISNTMFPSKQDMKDSFLFLFFLVFILWAWWWFRWPIPLFISNSINKLIPIFYTTIIINIIFLILSKILLVSSSKILKRKLIKIKR